MRLILALPLLGAATLLSRLPFRAGMLSNFDAVNYALALDHFDMRMAQPQAPGYPLYVLLGRLAALFFEPNTALVWVSVVFSALAVGGLYLAGRALFGERAGLIAALLAATAPPVWYMGAIAAPYTPDLFFSAISGWLCYRARETDDERQVWAAGIALGLAGALRLQSLVFLLPLLVFALWRHPWRARLIGLGVALVIFSGFFLPAVMLSGGPRGFLRALLGIVPIFRDTDTLIRTTRWVRFAENLKTMASYTVRTVGELVLLFVFAGWLAQPGRSRPWRDPKLSFLLIWLLPSWVFYFIIWPGNLGTIMVSMPPLFVLAGEGFHRILLARPPFRRLASGALAAALVWNVVIFTLLPKAPFGKFYRQFENWDSLRSSEESYRSRLALMRNFPVEGTVVYANNYRHMQYYLPEFHTFTYPRFGKSEPGKVQLVISIQDGQIETWKDIDPVTLLPAGTERIVFFDRPDGLSLPPGLPVIEQALNGYRIRVLCIPKDKELRWTADGLILRPSIEYTGQGQN